MTALSAEEIETERPKFEVEARKADAVMTRFLDGYQSHFTNWMWKFWLARALAAKADALAQQPPSELQPELLMRFAKVLTTIAHTTNHCGSEYTALSHTAEAALRELLPEACSVLGTTCGITIQHNQDVAEPHPVAQGGWQPIETAPKTKRSIMVWCADQQNTYVVVWEDEQYRDDYGWYHFGCFVKLNEIPTHWMPLLAAPGAVPSALASPAPKLLVWYGSMPETNGKKNWTAMLYREGAIEEGLTLDRSEYPDRVRYEADRARYLIGELSEEPDILAYDADLREPDTSSAPQVELLTGEEIYLAWDEAGRPVSIAIFTGIVNAALDAFLAKNAHHFPHARVKE